MKVNEIEEDTAMAKRGGFPGMGMPGNMNNLMKQAQKMQRQMEENQKALEEKRAAKVFGKSLEAKVTLTCSGELYDTLHSMEDSLPDVFIVSQVSIVNGDAGDAEPAVLVSAERAEGGKCERCWKVLPSVGSVEDHPTLCPRCARVVKSLL